MINDGQVPLLATAQDGTYPRPQLLRSHWADLSGPWRFLFDDQDEGLRRRWWSQWPSDDSLIEVPFPPESPASGIGDTGYHPVIWYHRGISEEELRSAGHQDGRRLMLHFGAVDYSCTVWVDAALVGHHRGGHTPIALDLTDHLGEGDRHALTVRVEDDPLDVAQPRGKQDWLEVPHSIWYDRTSGIWQPVWLESVPEVSVEALHWSVDVVRATVTASMRLSRRPATAVPVAATLIHEGRTLAEVRTTAVERDVHVEFVVDALLNGQGQDGLAWSPEHPVLLDALIDAGEDHVASYVGIRTAAADRGWFLLNDRPYFVRSVLNQGYWPQSHLAAPSAEALRAEVGLIKSLGFNATRIHQKFEDPRFLFWTDRLGLLVWAEAPACYSFSATAVERTVTEWMDAVERDFSHPSIVTWVPLNESWGVQHIAHDARMQHYARALADLTRALDPSRPVDSNDGWEQVGTDIVTIHDYTSDPGTLSRRYADRSSVQAMIDEVGPSGRRLVLDGDVSRAPIMLTEFGGVSYEQEPHDGHWAYSNSTTAEEYAARLYALFEAARASRALAGFCYTQLADTRQEVNGLVREDRTPKLPPEELRAMITGDEWMKR